MEQNHLSSRHLNTIHTDKGKEHLRDLLPVFKLLHLPVTSMTTYEALLQAREQTLLPSGSGHAYGIRFTTCIKDASQLC